MHPRLVYAYILMNASKMISDGAPARTLTLSLSPSSSSPHTLGAGSELLMLIPSYAPFVGPIVLPVLGAPLHGEQAARPGRATTGPDTHTVNA